MSALKILNLGLYFFICMMLLVMAGYELSSSLLDPTVSYANSIPSEIKSQNGWQLKYFAINIASIIVSILLIGVGIIYYKKGDQNNAIAFIYYLSFLLVLAIAALLIYLITLAPTTVQT